MNNVQLVGRVGKDPEVFTFENRKQKNIIHSCNKRQLSYGNQTPIRESDKYY